MPIIKQSEIYRYFHDNTKKLLDQYLDPDGRNKGHICPICGNGGGQDGDGLVLDPKREGAIHCFVCGFDGDIIDLIGQDEGITDNTEKLKRACEKFDIEIEPDYMTTATPKNEIKPTMPEKTQNTDREKNVLEAITFKDNRFETFINQSRNKLKTPRAIEYLNKRGISYETAQEMGVGYSDNAQIGNQSFNDCLIFPSTYAGFNARFINPTSDKYRFAKPKGVTDLPFGINKIILERNKKYSDLNMTLEPIFIVEGLFDALSIREAGGDAIALNGTGNIDSLIQILNLKGIKRPLLLALDNDEAGQTAQEINYKKLAGAGFEVYALNLIPPDREYKDANDFLIADNKGLETAVKTARQIPVAKFESTLNKSRMNDFLNGISDSVNAPAVKTGFATLDSKRFLDGGLYEGLYIIGAISSLGKTAFTLQLADQIATAGNDVLYFSLEMSVNELMARSISRYTARDLIESGADLKYKAREVREITDGKRYKYYTQPEQEYINESITEYFKDTGETMRIVEGMGNIDADTVRELVKEHVKHRGKAPVVFIDYLQLLIQPKDEKGNRYSMTDKQIVDANVFKLKQLSRDYKIPIFAISSFNRDNYNNEVSMLSFKESGAIEYSSDVLIGLERTDQQEKKAEKIKIREENEFNSGIRHIRLKVLKNRNGQQGGKLLFDYYYRYNYFKELGNEQTLNEFAKYN